MRDLFRESAFGRLVHFASRGRLFLTEEQLDPSLVQKYMSKDLVTDSRVSIPEDETLADDDPSHLEKEIDPEQEIDLEKEIDPMKETDHEKTVDPKKENDPHSSQDQPPRDDPEKGRDFQLVEWADNDQQNPRNWTTPKKFFVTFQICFLTTAVYIGSAIYTAGIFGVMEQFHVSQTVATLGLALFVIGYALGPMIWAPMSEMPFFGRNPIYISTLAVFVVLQLAVIYAKNIGMLLAFRFLTGFVGSPALATGGATIADMYTPQKQIYGIAVWGISAVFGPSLGPLVGGFAAESESWKWTIWELMWVSGMCLAFLFFCLPETSSANIIYRRTIRLRKITGNPNLKCEPELEAEGMTGHEIIMMILVRPFTLSFTEPICFVLNLYIALVYALLYLWFESFPLVFIDIYHFTLGTQGVAFSGILVGALVAMPPFFWYYHHYIEPQFNAAGDLKPELRLRPAFVGAFCIPICLFIFGWGARPSVHWIVPIIGSGFFSIGAFCLFMAVLSYLGDAYPKYVASVYAGNDLVRSSFGAAFPLFAHAMYKRLGIDWGSSLLGFLSILFIPIPFLLYRYGERIRHHSKMARHDL